MLNIVRQAWSPLKIAALATCMRAQEVKAQLKKPQRQKLPWMKDDEDTAAASGDLLTAVTPAPVAATAMTAAAVATASAATEAAAVAMVATETEPAEAAEVVQAHTLRARALCVVCGLARPAI